MNTESTALNAQLFINGEWLESQGEQTLAVTNPATQELLGNVNFATADEVNLAVASANIPSMLMGETVEGVARGVDS
jgi:malonate-semialdehyde dehydrogenase (acetylating)/methylmalonate-semialdehyde dehydrogenase